MGRGANGLCQRSQLQGKDSVRKVDCKGKGCQKKKLGDMLINEDAKCTIFKIANQMVKKNQDVVGAGCMKDVDGSIVMDGEKIMETWKKYYEKL